MVLPHGDVGRIVNSFTSWRHPDAIEWQIKYRQDLLRTIPRNKGLMAQIRGRVYLVKFLKSELIYQHAYRLPDFKQIRQNMIWGHYYKRKVFPCKRIKDLKRKLSRLTYIGWIQNVNTGFI